MKTPGDKYLQYMAGFHCGAGCKTIDVKRAKHEDSEYAALYNEGWNDGRKASREASQKAGERFGYTPSVIKAANFDAYGE